MASLRSPPEYDPFGDVVPGLRTILVVFVSLCFCVFYVTGVLDMNHTDTEYAAGNSGLTNSNVDSAASVATWVFFALLTLCLAALWALRGEPLSVPWLWACIVLALPFAIAGWTWLGLSADLLRLHGRCGSLLNPASSRLWHQRCYGPATALTARYQPSAPDPDMSLSPDTTFVLAFVFGIAAFFGAGFALWLTFAVDAYQTWFSAVRKNAGVVDTAPLSEPGPGRAQIARLGPLERSLAALCTLALRAHLAWRLVVAPHGKSPEATKRDLLAWHQGLARRARADGPPGKAQ